MQLIKFKPIPEAISSVQPFVSNSALLPKKALVHVGGEPGFFGGLGKGVGQGVGIGLGLLVFGAGFALLKGKRIG